MFGPTLSRIALRLVGLALGAWGGLHCWVAWILWQEEGRFRDVARIGAVLFGSWGAFDLFAALFLLLAKNWARYAAFLTIALHFALTFFVYRDAPPELAPLCLKLLVAFGASAVLLVLANNAEKA